MNLTEAFFKELFGESSINFRCINGNGHVRNQSGFFDSKTISKLKQLNQEDFEVYFVVNSGGYRNEEIHTVNSVFIDLDIKKEVEHELLDLGSNPKEARDKAKAISEGFSMEQVNEYKGKFSERIKTFELRPTYVIETRNGYHVYWFINKISAIEKFIQCERRLISYFKADDAVRKPCNLLRVPEFYWCKNIENKFLVRIIEHNEVRYDIDSIINALPVSKEESDEKPGDLCVQDRNRSNNIVSISDTQNSLSPPKTIQYNVPYISQKDIKTLQEVLQPQAITVANFDEVYDYLKKQDLNFFLGLPRYFRCIFHKDSKPSASVFEDPNTGYYWYKCFSESCGVLEDIISITQKLLRCSTAKALNFLRKVYRIEVQETEWQLEQKEIIENNIRLLQDEERLKQLAPETYKRIKGYLLVLIVILEFAKENINTENFTDEQGNVLFYAGTEFLAGICHYNNARRIGDRIALFAYLGLLNKLSDSQIPEFLLREAKHQAAKKKQVKRTNYYSVPSYNEALLEFSELKAKTFIEKGYTMRGWSREMILRAEGEAEADRVYPQDKGKQLSELSHEVTALMEKIALDLIEGKGWTSEKEIIEQITLNFRGQQDFKQKHIKRIIPEMMEKYSLKKIPANRQIKAEYGISEKGYPKIIVRSSND